MSKHIQYTITPASTGLILTLWGRFFSVFPTTSTRANNGAKTIRLGPVSFQFGNVATVVRPRKKARIGTVAARSAIIPTPPEDPRQLTLEGVV